MELGQQAKGHLQEASKWAVFLSILGFIGIGLMIILSFTIGSVLSNLPLETLGGLSPQFFFLLLFDFCRHLFCPRFLSVSIRIKNENCLDQ